MSRADRRREEKNQDRVETGIIVCKGCQGTSGTLRGTTLECNNPKCHYYRHGEFMKTHRGII